MDEYIREGVVENKKTSFLPAPLVILVGILIIIILITGVVFFLTKKQKKINRKEGVNVDNVSLTASPTEAKSEPEFYPETGRNLSKKTKGSLTLKLLKDEIKLHKKFSLQILADSGGEQVVGFDIIVKYDTEKLKFISARSTLKEFRVFVNRFDNYINLTFIKNLEVENPIYLENSPIAVLEFEPLTKESAEIEIVKDYGKRETFFTNENTELIYPALSKKLRIEAEE